MIYVKILLKFLLISQVSADAFTKPTVLLFLHLSFLSPATSSPFLTRHLPIPIPTPTPTVFNLHLHFKVKQTTESDSPFHSNSHTTRNMSSGRGGLSKLGTALTIIFVIALVALFIEIFYVLWRRRVFRRQNPTVLQGGCGGGDQLSQYSSDCSVSSTASSKELLYFFCIRPRETNSNTDGPNSNAPPQMDIDVLKLQGMHGPSRFLFTINEEEREDFELPLAEKDQNQSETVSLEEGVNLTEESQEEFVVVVVAAAAAAAAEEAEEEVDHVRDIDATPFSTPCASPVYFTPSASPVHELVNTRSI